MKSTGIIILLFGMFACENQVDKNVVDGKVKTKHKDSVAIESKERSGQPPNEFQNCNFDIFINDEKTPKLARKIWLNKNWNLSNENEALALLDSLDAKNKISRSFYFKVVTMTYEKSDGYFSEGLGHKGKEYVENNTEEFAANFESKDCFTERDLDIWAKIVLLEFHVIQENVETTKEEHLIYAYCRKLIAKSEQFSFRKKNTIVRFTKKLKYEWSEFLKNI